MYLEGAVWLGSTLLAIPSIFWTYYMVNFRFQQLFLVSNAVCQSNFLDEVSYFSHLNGPTIYKRLSLSQSPGDQTEYFELSVV